MTIQLKRSRVCTAMILSVSVMLTTGCEGPEPPRQTPDQPVNSPSSPPERTAFPPLSWQTASALLDQLEPYQDVEDYEVRVPKGYEAKETPPFGPIKKQITWLGKQRPDKPRPSLYILMCKTSPEEVASTSREKLFGMALPSRDERGSDWQQTQPETGQVGGLTFWATQWQGTIRSTDVLGTTKSLDCRGIVYAVKGSDIFVVLAIQGANRDDEETMKLLTTAVLTFRKKTQEKE